MSEQRPGRYRQSGESADRHGRSLRSTWTGEERPARLVLFDQFAFASLDRRGVRLASLAVARLTATTPASESQVPAELRERLRALGYVAP